MAVRKGSGGLTVFSPISGFWCLERPFELFVVQFKEFVKFDLKVLS